MSYKKNVIDDVEDDGFRDDDYYSMNVQRYLDDDSSN